MHAAEASCFGTSEMLASFLSSTPLLSQSWGLCSRANAESPRNNGFLTEQIGTTGYVAFSGVQFDSPGAGFTMTSDPTCRNLVLLDDGASCNSLFSPINGRYEGEEPVMVDAWSLRKFLSMYQNPSFQSEMDMLRQKSKSIVITGHSMGGSIASLCALWLLSCPQFSGLSVLCITFGSPLLGNVSLSRAVLRERWGGHFCHVVSKYDIMPRVLLTPLAPIASHLHCINHYWRLSMTSSSFVVLAEQLNDQSKAEMFSHVSVSLEVLLAQAEKGTMTGMYWPFGSYFFCSEEGAICLDNATSVIMMMQLLFTMGSPSCCIEDHLKYEAYVGKLSSQFQVKRNFVQEECPESSCEASLCFSLQSSGIACQEASARPAKDCLKMARRMGCTPNLNCANLAVKLSKITPYRAEIQWYQESCDQSDDQIGYYDSFKKRGASKRGSKVNMNRHKLAHFWDNVIKMLENNELPHDFHRRAKWVNASHFYKLLVEPLDIAEYYRTGMNHVKGHYISHGRERRYWIFDRWWEERTVREKENNKRSKFASLTQDSCFWARLEEAREWLDCVRNESNLRTLASFWKKIVEFQRYASELVERKEVSTDVVAKNSSYSLWVRDFQELTLQMTQFHTQILSFM